MPHISIILVDDDEDDRDLFFQALMEVSLSIKYEGCVNGSDALKKLSNQDAIIPDLIFMDLNMPGMNGFECLKKIREIVPLKKTPIIIYSTATKLENKIDEIYQPVRFLSKPSKFDDIVLALKVIISHHILESEDT